LSIKKNQASSCCANKESVNKNEKRKSSFFMVLY
jgi:hypothetical protein